MLSTMSALSTLIYAFFLFFTTTTSLPTDASAHALVARQNTSQLGPPPIVNVTIGNIITILGVLLFGIGLGLVIWWYYGEARVKARDKRNGVA